MDFSAAHGNARRRLETGLRRDGDDHEALFSRSFVSLCPVGVTVTLPCGHKRLGLMPSDTVVSQRNAFKELSRLVKLGLLPCDAVVSQRKASKEQSRLVKLGLLDV